MVPPSCCTVFYCTVQSLWHFTHTLQFAIPSFHPAQTQIWSLLVWNFIVPSLQSISYLAPICHTYLFSQPDPDWIPWLYGILNLPTNCHKQATSVGPNLTKGVFQGEERSKVDQFRAYGEEALMF